MNTLDTIEFDVGEKNPTFARAELRRRETAMPLRPAWVEVDLAALAANIRLIRRDLPSGVRLMYVLKDEAYGLGARAAARVALENGADELAVYTLAEALNLRDAGITKPILLLGERTAEELPWLPGRGLIPCIGSLSIAEQCHELGRRLGRRMPVHLKINTGMNRFGFSWRETSEWLPIIARFSFLDIAGVLSHFAQSDEADKTFAREQIARFRDVVDHMAQSAIGPPCLHLCNSGGFLDLPEAHYHMVRVGLLALGVHPSSVCRRLTGLKPVLSVKSRVAAIQQLQAGDSVGYGMRYRATEPRRIGVVPLGYGDGYPRVRNEGTALVSGRKVPLIGGVSMDALTIDLTEVPEAGVGSEVVLLGSQGSEEVTVHEIAALKRSVSYDVLVGWRARLPRRYLGADFVESEATRTSP